MIRAVRANQKGFHTALLQPGVNLILADRSTSAGDKDTTNALGKSTLIEIIDFCLASNTSPGKGLRIEALQGWAFTLALSLSGREVTVTRATDTPGFFAIEGATDDWPVGDFTSGFDHEGLVRLRLTDTDPTGSLLGFRY